MLLYYITDRTQFSGAESERCDKLLDKIAEAARCGVDFVQLREKDLTSKHLESLATKASEIIRGAAGKTRLLINSRTDVALVAGAEGVHLRSRDISPAEVRAIWHAAGKQTPPIVALSCHSEAEAIEAARSGTDFGVFGPIFGKQNTTELAAGVDALHFVTRHKLPLLALGGVTLENAGECLRAGAAGIAAIRLFQENDIETVVAKLRSY